MIVVVVAEDCKDPVRRRERLERLGGRLHVLAIAPRDVIPTEHDQIGPLIHQRHDRAGHIIVGYPVGSMHVGDEADAKT